MATPQELAQQARQKLVTAYGSEQAAQEAARRVRSGQFSAADTRNFANATGIADAAARSVVKEQPPAGGNVVAELNPAKEIIRKPVGTQQLEAVPPSNAVTPPATVVPPAPKPLVPVATVNVGAVERPGVAASTASPVAPSGMGSPDADRFVSLSSKSPSELTDDDRAFLRQVNAKAALMGGINKALGIDGSTFQGNRVEATASGFTLYGQDGQPRQATPQEAEAIRRSSAGQNAVKVFQENETARKQAEAAAASLKSEEQRRQESRKQQLSEYEQVLRQAADKSVATIREQGQQRKNSVQNNFSAMGGGRSSDAIKSVDEVQKAIDEQVSVEEKKYQAQVQAYLLQQQGADEEALKPYRDAVRQADLQLGQLQATAFQRMQEANAAGAVQNEQALQNLLNTMTTQAKSELALTGFDEKESARLGYFVRKDAQGNVSPMVGKDGEPIQFKSATVEAQKPVKIGEDAKGRDIMGVYNTQTGKYEPLAYGVAAARTGGSAGAGVGGMGRPGAVATAATPAPLTAAQRSQLDAMKGEFFTDKARDTLANAGITKEQVDAYATEFEVGPELATAVQNALSVIPTQLKNSDFEGKNYRRLAATILKKNGGDFIDAQRQLLGQVLPKDSTPEQQEALQTAFQYLPMLEEGEQTGIVAAIRSGNIPNAVKAMESAYIKKQSGGQPKFSEATTIKAVRTANEIEGLVKEFESKFGPISGRWETLKTKFKNNPQAQALISRMTEATTRMRNELSGTEVTATEGATLEPITPKITDPVENVIEKISTVRDASISAYNSEREAAGLPRIDAKTLLSPKERVKIYKNPVVGDEINNPSTGNVLPNIGKTYKVTDSTGQTEEVTAESFWKQAQDQYDAAINAGNKALADRIEAESERLAKQNGIPNPQ